jgi:hypothetical protein
VADLNSMAFRIVQRDGPACPASAAGLANEREAARPDGQPDEELVARE